VMDRKDSLHHKHISIQSLLVGSRHWDNSLLQQCIHLKRNMSPKSTTTHQTSIEFGTDDIKNYSDCGQCYLSKRSWK
jgi:hypothetical protein